MAISALARQREEECEFQTSYKVFKESRPDTQLGSRALAYCTEGPGFGP